MEHPGNGDRWLGRPVLAIWACCGRMVIVDAVRVRRGSGADGMSAQAKLICTVGWIVRADLRPSHVHVWCGHRLPQPLANHCLGCFHGSPTAPFGGWVQVVGTRVWMKNMPRQAFKECQAHDYGS